MFEAVVDRFLTKSPLTVMARLVLDRAYDPDVVDVSQLVVTVRTGGRGHISSSGPLPTPAARFGRRLA